MCMSKPKAPEPLPERQAAQAPRIEAQGERAKGRERMRQGFARLNLNRVQAGGLIPATTGKALLGN